MVLPRAAPDRRRWLGQAAASLAGAALPGAARSDGALLELRVDSRAAGRPISPLIYGLNWADVATLRDLDTPLNRQGGNSCSRYHWQLNAHAAGADWYFQSLPSEGEGAGARVHRFVEATRQAGAQAMVTLPMIDWLARLGPGRRKLASFSQARYGAQSGFDAQWFPDAGNGLRREDGQPLRGNDPADAGSPNSPALQQAWVQRLRRRHGSALRWYVLDNEPSLWHVTHRDVQPEGLTMDGALRRMVDYARAIRRADPEARIAGPEEWGWSGWFHSGYDQQWRRAQQWCCPGPDRERHGGADYLPWLLAGLHEASQREGMRLLDACSLHVYPEGGEHGADVSPAMQRRRNRSTRALWDAGHVDESWIGEPVRLIPRLRDWVAQHFPGLQLALTEYSWGAEAHMNGATAQADLLGLFGREGLDLAARWEAPAAGTPTYLAMKLYRNPDGRRRGFGDRSLPVQGDDPDRLAAFAARRSDDGALTLMLVHKELAQDQPLRIRVDGWPHRPAAPAWQAWQLARSGSDGADGRSRAAISPLPLPTHDAGEALALTLPAQSVTLLVLPRPA